MGCYVPVVNGVVGDYVGVCRPLILNLELPGGWDMYGFRTERCSDGREGGFYPRRMTSGGFRLLPEGCLSVGLRYPVRFAEC